MTDKTNSMWGVLRSVGAKMEGNRKIDKNILARGPKITAIGGGTGLSTMLRGIKKYTSNITAIVTVADDGGGSGVLRQELKMLPPGDIRNCILALSETEPVMKELLSYRFEDGSLAGQSFGNLFLAAMNGINGNNFITAIQKVSDVLNITGQVLPVTETDVELIATLENSAEVHGESAVGKTMKHQKCRIKKVRLEPANAKPTYQAIEAILGADIITLGPGSLFTSVIPNLIVPGIADAIRMSNAPVVYINNIMTQPGETEGYTAFDHVKAILDHTSNDFLDYCIVNTSKINKDLLFKYIEDGAGEVILDEQKFFNLDITIDKCDLLSVNEDGHIRHDAIKLAEAIMDICINKSVLSKC